jgi:hypothetical protein
MSQTSTTHYNTRSRTRARASSVSTPANVKNVKVRDVFGELIPNTLTVGEQGKVEEATANVPSSPSSGGSPLTSEGKSSRTPSETGSAMRTVRSYSDVVRASSPESDHVSQEKQPTVATAVVGTEADSSVNISDEPSMEQAAYETASENSESPTSEDGDDRPWTTVARKRNKGQEIRSKEPESDRAKRPDELTDEQRTAVRKAEGRLTEAERTKLALREEKVRQALEIGPSKGKGTDPRNWGGIQLVPEEIDLAAQKAALESYRLAKRQEETDSEQRESGSESDRAPPSKATKRRIEKALQGLENSLRLKYERELAAVRAEASTTVACDSRLGT